MIPEFLLPRLDEIRIDIDERLDGVYLFQDPVWAPMVWHTGQHVVTRPRLLGSTQAFGAVYARGLAAAYLPEGLEDYTEHLRPRARPRNAPRSLWEEWSSYE